MRNIKNLLFILTVLLLIFKRVVAQTPSIEWEKCYQTTSYETSRSVQQTNDGGYIFAGTSNFLLNNSDVYIVKISDNGTIQWTRSIGQSGNDYAWNVEQTFDNGFIIIGQETEGTSIGNHGLTDVFVIKLSFLGEIEWQKCFGGSNEDIGMDIHQTSDGGYIFSGHTNSIDGDVNGLHQLVNTNDAWVVKLDNTGMILWQKCLGGTGFEMGCSISETSDGGYILGGVTSSESNDGDVNGYLGGSNDGWIVKLNQSGNVVWQKCLGGIGSELISSISTTTDGGYIFTGWTSSIDIEGYHSGISGVTSDVWIAKINNSGILVWQKCLGGTNEDEGNSIKRTSDGGYIFSGWTGSFNGDVGFHYSDACWVIKLNNVGSIEWQKLLDGGGDDKAYDVEQTNDGGFIVSASTDGSGLDISEHFGGFDAWIIKLGLGASIIKENQTNINLFPNPSSQNYINLTFAESFFCRSYLVQDINGFKVLNGIILNSQEQIDISKLKNGIYFIIIEGMDIPIKFLVN